MTISFLPGALELSAGLLPALSNELVSAGFALAAAVCWGGSDFSGGVGAKGANAATVVMVAQGTGLLCLLVLVFAAGEPVPSSTALLWGAAAGLGAGIGLVCFYRALAIGQMGINAPVAALVTSGLTVLFGIWHEGMPAPLQIGGFALALVAIFLMTFSEGTTSGLALAICGGVGFSVYLICGKQAAREAVYWPLVIGRAASIVTLLVVVIVSGKPWKPLTNRPYMVVAGILDAIANVLFVYAVRNGRLDVATILSGFYPAVTVLCARFILNERVSRRQTAGIAAALIAVPLIAAH
jgi:drug/metabolite transporter (DMT)-like permease